MEAEGAKLVILEGWLCPAVGRIYIGWDDAKWVVRNVSTDPYWHTYYQTTKQFLSVSFSNENIYIVTSRQTRD